MTLCENWIDGVDVQACLGDDCQNPSLADAAAVTASELLFEFSGRQFPGLCEQTARPCSNRCRCPWQVLSRGHIIWNPMNINPFWGGYWGGWWRCGDDLCGCRPISRILLAGYVQEVVEVKIDGAVVNPDTYRIDRHRYLVRMRDPADPDTALFWPGCQNLDELDDQPGTFSVTYMYGAEVPQAGVNAAVQLAAEIYKACDNQPCKLPKGTTRVARSGLVIEKTPFANWGYETGKRGRQLKGWNTGLASVDAFLNAYNMNGLMAQPIFWSPYSPAQYGPIIPSTNAS